MAIQNPNSQILPANSLNWVIRIFLTALYGALTFFMFAISLSSQNIILVIVLGLFFVAVFSSFPLSSVTKRIFRNRFIVLLGLLAIFYIALYFFRSWFVNHNPPIWS